MKIQFFCLCFSLIFFGCSSGPTYTYKNFWAKEGLSYDDAVTITEGCKIKGIELVLGTPKETSPTAVDNYVESCMKSQGFRWTRYRF